MGTIPTAHGVLCKSRPALYHVVTNLNDCPDDDLSPDELNVLWYKYVNENGAISPFDDAECSPSPGSDSASCSVSSPSTDASSPSTYASSSFIDTSSPPPDASSDIRAPIPKPQDATTFDFQPAPIMYSVSTGELLGVPKLADPTHIPRMRRIYTGTGKPAACAFCRKRKIACSRASAGSGSGDSSCSACEQREQTCVMPEPRRKKLQFQQVHCAWDESRHAVTTLKASSK
ncbi:uncharacterized protein LAESUDRAFT_814164 [Laetiporus sulphureus 93-53]|uniref:Zn(2)-C6 fungal-type domain-containing protein n=1 Tax=Laetiporus sulphureus 93-53 TaxID=1314785 RepID=A0A165D7T1_9APHY|nr:uncharacterized protein LAESUDRAFT_814164 [Laetiporus sulphureus 93-53]KZT04292.1 hypothetical protein LAESUDRAFT_814164 [Laetiporus sulphureus 93-53]